MEQYHYLQLEILKKLLFAPELSYTELKLDKEIDNSKHTFHLSQLIKDGYIEKVNEKYRLSIKGKEYANRMDTDSTQIKKQGKVAAVQCGARNINGEWEFLIYTRLKQPNYGKQGFGTGKVWWGEKTLEAAKREFKEETNLDAEPELFKIEHQLVYLKGTTELVEDKYFFFYRFINPKGELNPNTEGKFEWVNKKDLYNYFTKPFEGKESMLGLIHDIINFELPFTYKEKIAEVEDF